MASIYKNGNLVQHMNNSSIPQLDTYLAMGMNPKTGLPYRMDAEDHHMLKDGIKRNLRIVDMQDAINRYTWYNLPDGLDGQLLERVLYYKGQGMFFYMEADGKFYFLPYALDGTIDVYGRYTGVTPLPFNGVSKGDKAWITGLVKTPVYSIKLDELNYNDLINSCVLLSDYSKQISQTVLPRQSLQEPVLDVMSDLIPFMRTNLLNSTGVVGMRVNGQDEYSNVQAASNSVNRAALVGDKYIPIIGNMEFQEMTGGNIGKSEEFLLSLQSLDNFRLSLYGLENGGLFQKKDHMLQQEQAMNTGNAGLVYQDGLTNRQNFCDIVNSIWGLGISCEPSDTVLNMDMDMNGYAMDGMDQSGTMQGEQPEGGANE